MAKTWPKLEKHPDCEEIKGLIEQGESPRHIALMLSRRHPTNKKLCISHQYLYEYRREKHPILAASKSQTRKTTEYETKKGTKGTALNPEVDIATQIMHLTGQTPTPPKPRDIFTEEQLLTWVKGTEGFTKFTEDMIVERGEPVKLLDYQVEMAKRFNDEMMVCIVAGGQTGKDFMMQNYIIWYAITVAGSLQMVLCATQSQSMALMNRILDKLAASGDLHFTFVQKTKKPEPSIIFKNGSRCLFLTAKSIIAGHTDVNIIYVNEARDVKEEEVTRVSPLLGISGGKLFVLSRPRFRRSYLWDCFTNPMFSTMQIPTDWNEHYDMERLEINRATMSPALFKIEHLGQFADAGSSYISETAIDACSMEDYEFKAMVADPDYIYALGIDWARLRDTCVFMVVGQHKKTKRKKVFYITAFSPDSEAPSTFEHHFAQAGLLDSKFRFTHVIPESSGMGIPLSDRLKRDWHRPGLVKPYENRSLQTKLDMYEECKRVIETGEIDIPRAAFRLINQLKMAQFGTTLHGHLKIENPVTDDYADALCLALMAFKRPFEISVGIVKRSLWRRGV